MIKERGNNMELNNVDTSILLSGQKDKAKLDVILDTLSLVIKVKMSNISIAKFYTDVSNLQKHLGEDTKVILIQLFLQIGQADLGVNTFEFKDKDNMYLYIQPKIKSFTEFKLKANAENYLQDEVNNNELYLFLDVVDGIIQDIPKDKLIIHSDSLILIKDSVEKFTSNIENGLKKNVNSLRLSI